MAGSDCMMVLAPAFDDIISKAGTISASVISTKCNIRFHDVIHRPHTGGSTSGLAVSAEAETDPLCVKLAVLCSKNKRILTKNNSQLFLLNNIDCSERSLSYLKLI